MIADDVDVAVSVVVELSTFNFLEEGELELDSSLLGSESNRACFDMSS